MAHDCDCPNVIWTESNPTPRGTLRIIRVVTTRATKLALTFNHRPTGHYHADVPGALDKMILFAQTHWMREHADWSPTLTEG